MLLLLWIVWKLLEIKLGTALTKTKLQLWAFQEVQIPRINWLEEKEMIHMVFFPIRIYFSLSDPRPKEILAMSSGAGTQAGWTANS